ncbi:probable serine/threonine-protein kinase At1g18390 isoform X1 [Solanum tuberosum]|uniref:probable serine/threonine-protein kinase At1g18390 isoform X1 n=1 Tax=Solanum tuberosum TaxID=4113 RepID=UPI00073A3D85|nr:PREDICTED: probable serine/threonine-protein kinase At1g18390 isoform X1 [Solanum tuberosum]
MLSHVFLVQWELSYDCYQCHQGGGHCQTDKTNKFQCTGINNPHAQDAKTTKSKLGVTLGAGNLTQWHRNIIHFQYTEEVVESSRSENVKGIIRVTVAPLSNGPLVVSGSKLVIQKMNGRRLIVAILTVDMNMRGPEILVEWKLSEECNECHYSGGQCQTDKTNKFSCHKDAKPPTGSTDQRKETTGRNMVGQILGTVFGGVGSVMITSLAVYVIWRYKKRKFSSSHFFSTRKLSNIFNHDAEGGSIYFGVSVFSYSELEEATDDFNSSRVLGDGGYGTVYYGKLKDGREIAVKRLYEHNCKRMEQFVNEIDILTRLRHNNLVTLYGCTSRRSRELLLVYEYIPNGTLADHLHGDRAKDGSLTWPVRMNIAIETAGALAYLHASDVIHCDVKTNNILLDHNFGVKVADFGISRLFPNDVSHISTTPRGTPGYIDPKYHECYQLTIKSDVYSFGVVLVELISSMPAVDMNRHSQEINLANYAINKIIKSAVNELIDPSLGFDSDTKTREMTTSVAELAFLCLQTDRDVRPTMVEVLDTLNEIQTNLNANEAKIVAAPPFPESEDIVLLKKVKSLPSPNSVTDKWTTCSDITCTK